MDEKQFWELIERTKAESGGDNEKHEHLLTDALVNSTVDNIREFYQLYKAFFWKAYRWDLWQAAQIVNCGCSDDGFYDFRDWLICQGQTNYERVSNAPEYLAQIVERGQYTGVRLGLHTAMQAYEQKTGEKWVFGWQEGQKSTPAVLLNDPDNETRTYMPEADFEKLLQQRFPILWSKFGDCSWDDV